MMTSLIRRTIPAAVVLTGALAALALAGGAHVGAVGADVGRERVLRHAEEAAHLTLYLLPATTVPYLASRGV